MPRYTTDSGVVVEISAEKAARVPGLKPVSGGSPARKAAPAKKQTASKSAAGGGGKSAKDKSDSDE